MDQGGLFSAVLQHEMDHFEGKCKIEEYVLNKNNSIEEEESNV